MNEDRFVDYHQKDKTFYPILSYVRTLYIKYLHTTYSFRNIFCDMGKLCKVIEEFVCIYWGLMPKTFTSLF